MQFCEILKEADDVYSGNLLSLEENWEKFVSKLKEITEHNKDQIVEKLLETMYVTELDKKNHSIVLCRFMSNWDLEELLEFMHSLVKTHCDDSLYDKYNGMHAMYRDEPYNIATLSSFLSKRGMSAAEELLGIMFRIGIAGLDFSDADKNAINALLPAAAFHIEECILDFEPWGGRYHINNLQRRSSLQYIKDMWAGSLTEFKDCMEKIDNSIECLDELINRYVDSRMFRRNFHDSDDEYHSDSFAEGFESDPDERDFEYADSLKVPSHHIWWLKYKNVYY